MALVKDLLKFEADERKNMEDVLKSNYFRRMLKKDEYYDDAYDDLDNKKPGLCVIITQSKYHNVNTA